MKSILSLIAVCTDVALAGCNSNKSNSVSPGAVGEKNGCCAEKSSCTTKDKASMGAVSDKECAKQCPMSGKKAETVSPGAVSEKKSGCCASKSACTDKKVDG